MTRAANSGRSRAVPDIRQAATSTRVQSVSVRVLGTLAFRMPLAVSCSFLQIYKQYYIILTF
jgi:hypothetical protein